MYLDLSHKSDNYKEFVVVHEFGHALGLGHEHQRSDFQACVAPYLDKTKMEQTFKKLELPSVSKILSLTNVIHCKITLVKKNYANRFS
jgi:hypothetical protein